MGMYTELYMSASLREDCPPIVVDVVNYLFGGREGDVKPSYLPNHPFFSLPRWEMIGACSSFYFTPFALSKSFFMGRKIYFTTRSDLKNYNEEISEFIDFIMPYIDAFEGEHLGHFRYEEDIEPTMIKKIDTKDQEEG